MKTITRWSLSSPAFKNGEIIPTKYTSDDVNVSPPLEWDPAPEGTKSVTLIVDDPDAPKGIWVHWVLYNLPVIHQLKENISKDSDIPSGTLEGINSSGKLGYSGPRPPSGMHRYFFRLYALDIKLALPEGAKRDEVDQAMKGHILAQAELMGVYRRKS